MRRLSAITASNMPKEEGGFFGDPQAGFVERAFMRAHGHTRGPLSRLTQDRRMQIETKAQGVQPE